MKGRVRKLVILFADIGDSTALYERVGDVEAHRLVAESLVTMRDCVESNHGVLLRTVGDASLASFQQADDALEAACDMQNAHASMPLSIRVGFHVGDVIPDGGDVYGHEVNVAARIASFARIDEITATAASVECLSESAREAATYLDRIAVKGSSAPIEVWRIDWLPQDGPQTAIASDARFLSTAPATRGLIELRQGTRRYSVSSDSPPIILGRATECDVIVDHDEASRRHAVIEFSQGQCLLTDTSTNGTWLCRPQTRPVLIRRDTVVLEGRGELGLGAVPGEPDAMPLAFRVSADEMPEPESAKKIADVPVAPANSAARP